MAGVSIGTGFAGNVLSGLWNNVVQEMKMIISLPQAVTEMDTQVQRLNNVSDHIKADLERKERNAYPVVQKWLEKVGSALNSSESITNEYQQHKNCLGCCPNCLCRYRLSKRIRAWRVSVDQLHSERESDFPRSGEYGDPTPPKQIPIQITELVGNGIQDAQSDLERLLTEDTNIRVIGVYGMGGVGKTSLLQTINNSDKVRESFELIIWLTVSRFDIFSLQDHMGERLNLRELPKESYLRTAKLYSNLKNKKFLVILDDMWSPIELKDLGVPLHDSSYKIVLSTRNQDVCGRMDADKIIPVIPLSEEEGWQLFCKGAFRNGNIPQEIEEVAKKIAGECKGLPLAIKVVAALVKNYTNRRKWEYTLEQMQTVDKAFYDLHNNIDKDLFQILKCSHNDLPDALKICFVYFAAYPEDPEIKCEEVIDTWIAEGIVSSSRDTAHDFIDSLESRCLIEVVSKDVVERIDLVRIHDVLRDMAMLMAENEHRCYFKAGQSKSRFPEEIDGKGYERVSLMKNNLESLPTTFQCSSLSVLLLRDNRDLKEVPESFLGELFSLRVLDLSYTGISSLPACIGNLKRLASLQLKATRICELPETIGDVKELQFLNVKDCDELQCIPERISELKHLKALQISGCQKLSHLPRGISELISLEILEMYGSISLNFEEDGDALRRNACLKDLQSLSGLRDFSGKMRSTVKDGVLGNWSKMRNLALECANQDYLPRDMQEMKDLEGIWLWGCDVQRLPWVSEFRKLVQLYLVNCKQLKELPAELPCLKVLGITECNKLEELELGMGFPKLEELRLEWLESLECVRAEEEAASGSGSGGLGEGASPLPMLHTFWVYQCHRLKRLVGRWDKLKCLERIVCGRKWWDAILEWEDPNNKMSLESKCKLEYI